jgi:hypothetical protein
MNKETMIEALRELQQDYVDDKHYYTALQIAIELLEYHYCLKREGEGK